jgi:hypothetical protein
MEAIIYESAKVENIKKGTLVKRSATAKKTFLRGDYCQSSKRYTITDYDDISNSLYIKKGTILFLDWKTND